MNDLPSSKELHGRAASSAKETRSTIISLSTASIGGLFFLATRDHNFALLHVSLLLCTLTLMVASLAAAMWFSYSDAQWSYHWGAELDPGRSSTERDSHRTRKLRWHQRKGHAERVMLVAFVLAAFAGAAFVTVRCLSIG